MFDNIKEYKRISMRELNAHPAVRAWESFNPSCSPISDLTILKENKKSQVYRILDDHGQSIIAKSGIPDMLRKEFNIYDKALKQMSLPVLKYYGHIKLAANSSEWIFMEDAGEDIFDFSSPTHRKLLAIWLSELHQQRYSDELIKDLPLRTLSRWKRFLGGLQSSLKNISSRYIFSSKEINLLDSLQKQLSIINTYWPRIRDSFHDYPETIVHGDLVPKNMRIGISRKKPALFVFDWDVSSWGVPFTDFARFQDDELVMYLRYSKSRASSRNLERMAELVVYGILFRLIDATSWVVPNLGSVQQKKAFSYLETYQLRISKVLNKLNWRN